VQSDFLLKITMLLAFSNPLFSMQPEFKSSEKIHTAILVGSFGLGLPTLIKLARNDFRTYSTDTYIKVIQAGSFIAAFSLLMWSIKYHHESRSQNINTDRALDIKQMICNA